MEVSVYPVGRLPVSMNPKDEKNPSNKYTRDGAKYVCTKCKAKYFTKMEAEACFDKCEQAAG